MYHLLSNVTSDFKYLSKTKIASIYTQDGKKVSSYSGCLILIVASFKMILSLTKQTRSGI